MPEKKEDNKGLLGLLALLGLGGLAWAMGKKPSEMPSLSTVSVEFHSPGGFYPGSQHKAVVTIRNSGNADAVGVSGTMTLIYSFGGSEPPFDAGLPSFIAAGQTVQNMLTTFIIPGGALPGEGVSYQLAVQYDGYVLNAQGPAFTVEAPLAPFLEQVGPPTFT